MSPPFDNDEIIVSSTNRVGRRSLVGRVTVPQFEIFSSPTVKIDDVRKRRFSLTDLFGPNIMTGGADV